MDGQFLLLEVPSLPMDPLEMRHLQKRTTASLQMARNQSRISKQEHAKKKHSAFPLVIGMFACDCQVLLLVWSANSLHSPLINVETAPYTGQQRNSYQSLFAFFSLVARAKGALYAYVCESCSFRNWYKIFIPNNGHSKVLLCWQSLRSKLLIFSH